MVEIIYFDIDGTLRDEVNGVSKKTRYAIDQCQKQKIRCVICTGRNLESIQEDVKMLPIDGIISGGGCYIQYHNLTLLEEHFPKKVVNRMIEMSLEKELSLSLEAECKIYMNRSASIFYQNDFHKKIHNYSPEIQEKIYGQHKIVFEDNMLEYWKDTPSIHKFCILGQIQMIDTICAEFKEEVEVIQKKKWNDKWYLELLPNSCNKGTAITWLNHKLGVKKNDTMCFGDSENDIDMMKATGIAIAMKNNNATVEKYASSVCESVEEDGIYKELVRRKVIQPEWMEKGRRNSDEKTVVAGGSYLPNLSQKF